MKPRAQNTPQRKFESATYQKINNASKLSSAILAGLTYLMIEMLESMKYVT